MASSPTIDSNNMDDIITPSRTLLRNEKWRIRESIYCNRTGKSKDMVERSNQLLSDESLREHYSELLNAIRKEMGPPMNPSTNGENQVGDMEKEPSFETLRQRPEIMTRIYSYLPLRDRICQLPLVDREFSRDIVRGGIVCATYGAGFNLKQALLELQQWATRELELGGLPENIHMNLQEDTVVQGLIESFGLELTPMKFLQERLAKISRMQEIAKLTDVEPLLFTGSNLTNSKVTPTERKQWMISHVRDFFAREKQEREKRHLERRNPMHSWVEETILVQKFIKRYFFDGTIDRLGQLMAEVHFWADYNDYHMTQITSTNRVDRNGNLVWCRPNLSSSCNVLFLDADEGWKEYRLVTCACCKKLVQTDANCHRSCVHGQHGHFCKTCRESFSEDVLPGTFCATCGAQDAMRQVQQYFNSLGQQDIQDLTNQFNVARQL